MASPACASTKEEESWYDIFNRRFVELKCKRPRLMFLLIMGIETLNFASDVAQLITVVDRYGDYNGPPWYYDDYSK